MVSTTRCSLRAASLKTVLTVGMVGRMYIPKTGEWGGASNCPGLACGSTGGHDLSMTSSNILSPSWGEKLEESFSQAIPFFYLHRTKQIKHVLSLRRKSLRTWTLEDEDIDLDPVSLLTSRAVNLLGLHSHHLLEEENNRFALHTFPIFVHLDDSSSLYRARLNASSYNTPRFYLSSLHLQPWACLSCHTVRTEDRDYFIHCLSLGTIDNRDLKEFVEFGVNLPVWVVVKMGCSKRSKVPGTQAPSCFSFFGG